MNKRFKTDKNSDDEEGGWKDFVLNSEDDPESPQKRIKSNLMSRMDISDKPDIFDDNSDGSDDEDVSKSVKVVVNACRCIYRLIERYTKLFSFFLHIKLLLKKNYILATRDKFQIIYLAGIVVFILCLVRFFQSIADDFTNETILNQLENNMTTIDRCFHSTDPCLTIGYGIIVSILLNFLIG